MSVKFQQNFSDISLTLFIASLWGNPQEPDDKNLNSGNPQDPNDKNLNFQEILAIK